MSKRIRTITGSDPQRFDFEVDEFIAEDYVSSPSITFSTTTVAGYNRDSIVFIAHIEYIDVRQ